MATKIHIEIPGVFGVHKVNVKLYGKDNKIMYTSIRHSKMVIILLEAPLKLILNDS